MRLRQTNDSVRSDVGVVTEHFLLLRVHRREHSEAVPQPAGEPLSKVRDLGFECFQSFRGQLDVVQLLANRFAAFGACPLLAFG